MSLRQILQNQGQYLQHGRTEMKHTNELVTMIPPKSLGTTKRINPHTGIIVPCMHQHVHVHFLQGRVV